MASMQVLYLHGLASSPASAKATFFKAELSKAGLDFTIPDLNVPSFEELSFSSILDTSGELLNSLLQKETIVMGSSLGALTALHLENALSSNTPNLRALILLAPAFDFRHNKRLTPAILSAWKSGGEIPIYHSAIKENRMLPYSFLEELEMLPPLQPPNVPTLIIHGKNDEVIGVEHSRAFAKSAPQVQLYEVESDHQMLSAFDEMIGKVREFLNSI